MSSKPAAEGAALKQSWGTAEEKGKLPVTPQNKIIWAGALRSQACAVIFCFLACLFLIYVKGNLKKLISCKF